MLCSLCFPIGSLVYKNKIPMTLRSKLISLLIVAIALLSCKDDEATSPTNCIKIDGKEYPISEIGGQLWTATNYEGSGGVSFDAENSKPEYGKYYTKAEIATIELPEGWRIPTQEDYQLLAESLTIPLPSNGTETEKVKALTSSANWNNVNGTNSSGFNAQPAGYIFGNSLPLDGDIAEFWTSEGYTLSIQEAGTGLSSLRMVFYDSNNSPDYRFNVRFVKN